MGNFQRKTPNIISPKSIEYNKTQAQIDHVQYHRHLHFSHSVNLPPSFSGGRMETGRPPPPTYISLLSSLYSPLHPTHAPAASFTTPFDFLLLEGILNAKVTLLQLPAGYVWIPPPPRPPLHVASPKKLSPHPTPLPLILCNGSLSEYPSGFLYIAISVSNHLNTCIYFLATNKHQGMGMATYVICLKADRPDQILLDFKSYFC